MKKITQVICLVLVLSVILAFPAMAAEVTPWASDFFGSHSCYLTKVGTTHFQVWFDVAAVRGMDELGASYIEIQKSADGVNWEYVASYSMSDYANLIATNTGTHGSYVNYYNAQPGYYYRALVTFYAKRGNGMAEHMSYTSSITMP